jgi:drug/metabolite transporter (DMT)-like permease
MDDPGSDYRTVTEADCRQAVLDQTDGGDDIGQDSLQSSDGPHREANPDSSPTAARLVRQPAELKPPLGIIAASICGMFAAVGYTAANIALRYSISLDPFLVSAMKAAPTVIFLGPFLIWMMLTQRRIATNLQMIPRFAVAALLAQLFGNGAFQVALGVIGLAASVPIVLGTLIIGGAVLGRVMLGEPVRLRTIAAMITLIIAVIVLSLPGAAAKPIASTSALPIWAGALAAASSGAAYAVFGVVMRQTLISGMSPPAAMFISGVIGVISLWSIALVRIGADGFSQVSTDQWTVMAIAGLCNFTAFVALTVALKALPVVAVNLINASQVALAAVAGVVLFTEPVTWPLLIGIGLTFAGLMMLASRRNRASKISAATGKIDKMPVELK